MPRATNGTYTLPAGNPVVSGSVIDSSWANTTLSDIATALDDSLSRSGKGSLTAPFKLIDGLVSAPALTFASETGTGIYRAGANDLRIAVGGVDKITANATGLSCAGLVVTGSTFTVNGNTGWHAGNDGTGTGLDADLLDGQHASAFAAAGHGHAATAITQDASNRFVSDSEKATWNAKQAALGYTAMNAAGGTMTGNLGVQGTVTATGDVIAYGSVPSDRRLKKNITGIFDPLGKVRAIQPVDYEWDEDACLNAGILPNEALTQGVIAQDVAAVVPSAILHLKGHDGQDYLGVRYERLVPVLLGAVHELAARVEALETR